MVLLKIQTLFAFGADEKAEDTVITAPEIPLTGLVSTDPSDKITLSVGLFVVSKSVSSVLSTVTVVVVADFILPPLLSPLSLDRLLL